MAKIKNRTGTTSHKTKPRKVKKDAFERVYWPYIPIVIVISLLLSLGARGGSLQAFMSHPAGRVLDYSTSMSLSGLLADTNAQRVSNGVSSLNLNNQLDAAAQAKANDMAARNYWSHNTPEGNPPWIFVTAQGYDYQKLGENLATGFSDEQATINGWMASPPHRENLLDPAFSDVGFGFANNPDYTAAGGGPMTIVVAFYGQPQVLSASTSAPPAAPANTTPPPASSAPTAAPTPAPTPAAAAAPPPAAKQPATTQNDTSKAAPATQTSRIQLAVSDSKISPSATVAAAAGAGLVLLYLASRHIFALRRLIIKGEAYAIHHPLTDIGLLVIAALLFILTQSAGIIQ